MKAENDKQVRERLVARGVESLSNEELLSLVLPPRRGEQSLVVARRLYAEVGESLGTLSRLSLAELRQTAELGMERASSLVAMFELGRRAALSEGEQAKAITGVADIVSLFQPLVGALPHEELWVVYLTSANRIIERKRVSVGGSTALIADTKLILKRALNLVASSLIVVHNHPSGTLAPSPEDERLTMRLAEAARLLDMQLLDHIIIGRNGGHYSFRSEGKLR